MPMSSGFKCYNCGKGNMIGHNVSHAKNRTRKVFRPNLHPARIVVDGTSMRVRLCTKSLRLVSGKDTRSKKSVRQAQDKIAASLKEKEVSTVAPVAAGLA